MICLQTPSISFTIMYCIINALFSSECRRRRMLLLYKSYIIYTIIILYKCIERWCMWYIGGGRTKSVCEEAMSILFNITVRVQIVFSQLLWKLLTVRIAANRRRWIYHFVVSERYSLCTNRYKLNFKKSLSCHNLQR